MSLRLDWCSHEAAKYACEHWHYSGCVPAGKILKIGVWEDGAFIGVVLFGLGANKNIGAQYKLPLTQVCELVRIALKRHKAPVSQIVAIALRMLKRQSPGSRLVVSYADPREQHHGGIYQAGNWVYTGKGASSRQWWYRGKWTHNKTVSDALSKQQRTEAGLRHRTVEGKHKYLYPLDNEMRANITQLAKPYPKRASEAGL